MAREFFTLLGRILRTNGSKQLLEGTNIFRNLSRLGKFVSLDYISRLVFSSLSICDGGMMSKHLLQLWTTQSNCSLELKNYLFTILRVLVRSKPLESFNWCIDLIVNQITSDEHPLLIIYKALEESVHNKQNLKTVIGKRPQLMNDPYAQNILLRFLAIPEGIEYLTEKDWLDTNVVLWQEKNSTDYVVAAEEKISLALSKRCSRSIDDELPEIFRNSSPIPIRTPDFINEVLSKQSSYTSQSSSVQDNYNDPNITLVFFYSFCFCEELKSL
jgi:hypothetical protein